MRKILFAIIGILFVFTAYAQPVEDDFSKALKKEGKIFIRFDTKNSFISNTRIKLWGMQFGYNYNNTVKYGFGIHDLRSDITRNFTAKYQGVNETINANFNYSYFSIFGEYVFYKNKNWEGSLPISVGLGVTNFSGNFKDSSYQFHDKFILQYDASLTGHYQFLRYFALGGGIGYRIMILNTSAPNMQLTNPIYVIKLKFFLGDLFNDTKAYLFE